MKRLSSVIIAPVALLLCSVLFLFSYHVIAAVPPQVNTAFISLTTGGDEVENIDLVENSTQDIFVYGEFGDEDGCSDVENFGNLSLTLYRSGVSGGANCVENNRNCYTASYASSTCTITGCSEGTELTAGYECQVSLQYYAEPTDVGSFGSQTWDATVIATDASSTSGSLTSNTEVNSLVAIQVDTLVDYGSFALGATSTTDTIFGITNTGNTTVDGDVSGIDMVCSRGVIPVTNQRFSLTPNNSYEDMSVVSSSPVFVDLNLAPQTNSSQLSTTSLYFKMVAPEAGVNGTCGGQNLVTGKINE